MLKGIALAAAAATIFGGTAMAQTVRPPIDAAAPPALLVKHDGKHDNGRHLGWYKNNGRGAERDGDYRRFRNRAGMPYGRARPGYWAPGSHYNGPGYGSSYPQRFYGRPY